MISNKIKQFLILLFFSFFFNLPAFGQAALLPNGKQVFLDSNGNPLTSGKVYFYIPSTKTLKTTWQNSGKTILNTNPVILDAAGRAIIYGDGTYRQIVTDSLNNIIWDAITASAGTGGSTTSTGDGDLVGTVKPWAGLVAPNQYAFAYGQELSRTTYATLLTAITLSQVVTCTSGNPILTGLSDTTQIPNGAVIESTCATAGSTVISKTNTTVTLNVNAPVTTSNTAATFFLYGNGNGATTFNLPDLRGNVIAGRSNMGGTNSTNLTSTYFGANPQATGAAGGLQTSTLATINFPPYTPAGSNAVVTGTLSGTINASITDPGHFHPNSKPVSSGATATGPGPVPNVLPAGNTDSATTGVTATVNLASGVFTGSAPAFTGTAQGGTTTPFANVQPTLTLNYIIKITPDTNSASASGVTSLGSMTGDIACGTGLTCTGNIISVGSVTATNITVGSTNITSGTSTGILFNNGGVLGNSTSSTGTLIAGSLALGSGAFTGIPLDIVGRLHATQATFSNGAVTAAQPLQVDIIPTTLSGATIFGISVGSLASPYTPPADTGLSSVRVYSYINSPYVADPSASYTGIFLYNEMRSGANGTINGASFNAVTGGTWTNPLTSGGTVALTALALASNGSGDNFGGNISVQVPAAVTATRSVHALELDVNNGSSTAAKFALAINLGTGATDAGTVTGTYTLANAGGTTPSSFGIFMQAAATSAGVSTGLGFIGQNGGAWPITTTGTVIEAAGGIAAYGIRMTRGTTFTTAAIATPGFTVDGSGNIIAGVFQGTPIIGTYGGTGVNNSTRTITVGGNFVTAGAASLPSIAQGDLWYGSATGVLSALAKSASASQFLKNSGTSNNPAWAQPTFADLSGGTAPAFTLGGTVSGGGNQINNVIIGTSTPLTGFFTTLSASASLTSLLHIGGTGTTGTQLTFQTTTGNGTTDAFVWNRGNNGATLAMTLNNTGLGLGTVAPDAALTLNLNAAASVAVTAPGFHIVGADTTATIGLIDTFAAPGQWSVRRADGTLSSKSAVISDVPIFSNQALAWDGSAYNSIALIQAVTAELQSGTAHGSVLKFFTTPATTTTLTEAIRIQPSGGVTIGATITTDPGVGGLQLNGQAFAPNMASDTATADSTVCTATTGGKLLKGTGALGICLGTSGRQFKTDFEPMAAGINDLMKISFTNYRYRNGHGDDGAHMQYGTTAQDVEKVLPDLVRHDITGTAINYDSGALLFIGLRSIQQLKADNDNLHAANDNLRQRLETLERKIN